MKYAVPTKSLDCINSLIQQIFPEHLEAVQSAWSTSGNKKGKYPYSFGVFILVEEEEQNK